MLILTRTPNKRLCVGDEIKIKVLKVKGNAVFLGVDAPKSMRIVRSVQERKPLDDGSPPREP